MLRALAVVVLSLVATATAFGRDTIADREQYWRVSLPNEVPIGSPEQKLISWLKSKKLDYNKDPRSQAFSFIPETLKGDGVVCKSWSVVATADVDASGKVIAYKVGRAGTCL